MINVADYYRPDPNAFERGFARGNALRERRARLEAGNALSGGDYGAAANALYGAGEIELGSQVAGAGEQRQAAAAKAVEDREAEVLKLTSDMAGRLSAIADESKDPQAVVSNFERFFVPRLRALGETDEEIAQVRQGLMDQPRETLLVLGASAAKQQGYEIRNAGEEVFVIDPQTGNLVNRYRGARTVPLSEGGALYELPGSYGGLDGRSAPSNDPTGLPPGSGIRTMAPTAPGAQTPPADSTAIMPALIAQESGGNGNAIGPETPYGRALGSTQMLPETAEAMARKLGVPWRPDLMRGDTERALQYQRQLGEAYLREGLEKYGGDVRQALMYYHGGPNEELWGPKTRRYADEVMARMGQGAQSYEVASAGETPPPPTNGPRLIASRPAAEKPQSRPATAEEKARYGIPANVPAQVKPDGSFDVIDLPKGVADNEKAQRALESQVLKARDIIGTVDNVLKRVGSLETGLIGSQLSRVPGTAAYDVAREVETIKANLGFQELQAMREASPTGGALGAIAVQELVALQSTVANLDIGQSEAQLRSNLQKIKNHYERWLAAVEGRNPNGGQKAATPTAKPTTPKRMRFDERGNRIE